MVIGASPENDRQILNLANFLYQYNVYRNNVIIGEEIDNNDYYDHTIDSYESYNYTVTAIYSEGESSHSNLQIINTTNETDKTNFLKNNKLYSNYPNPFNPETKIEFYLANNENVKLSVYNLKGQHIKTLLNKMLETGNHSVIWDGKNSFGSPVASGIYFYKLETIDEVILKKMILLK
jgi:hypothetical protein